MPASRSRPLGTKTSATPFANAGNRSRASLTTSGRFTPNFDHAEPPNRTAPRIQTIRWENRGITADTEARDRKDPTDHNGSTSGDDAGSDANMGAAPITVYVYIGSADCFLHPYVLATNPRAFNCCICPLVIATFPGWPESHRQGVIAGRSVHDSHRAVEGGRGHGTSLDPSSSATTASRACLKPNHEQYIGGRSNTCWAQLCRDLTLKQLSG